MNETHVTIVGNVASEVRYATTEGGVAVASFRVASTPRRYTQGQWSDGHTSYVTVKCWRGLADNVRASLSKGQPVVLHGRQTVRPWERDGKTGTSVDIDADAVGHDLRWGTTAFTNTTRLVQEREGAESVAVDLASSFDVEEPEDDSDRDDDTSSGFGGAPVPAARDGWAVPGASSAAAA